MLAADAKVSRMHKARIISSTGAMVYVWKSWVRNVYSSDCNRNLEPGNLGDVAREELRRQEEISNGNLEG